MWRKRAVIWLMICITAIGLLIGRLIQVQLVSTESFTKHRINLLEASVVQRSQQMVLDNGRGGFLDRNGESLVHRKVPVLILFPFLKNMEWDSEKVAEIVGVPKESIQFRIKQATEPFAYGEPSPLKLTDEQMEEINALEIPGVFAVERKYSLLDFPAEQLIGITGENMSLLQKRYPEKELSEKTIIGLTGLEKSFDEFLLPDGNSRLIYHVDAKGGPLFGIDVKYVEPANPFYPVNIKTTIDKDIQKVAEELVDQYKVGKGGVVLLDLETNSVLAMVSRPKINKEKLFNDEANGVENAMVSQQILGSVFKTVVAGAAIDNGLDDPMRMYDCSKKINGEPDTVYDHGMLNFNDSFAVSCNNTFGTLAKEMKDINPNILEEFAEKLSLVGTVGWSGDIYHFSDFKQIQDEETGRVFLTEEAKKDKNFVAMSGIGQHEVRATPLAVANMMGIIAKGGVKESVRVVSEVEYKNGSSLLPFEKMDLQGDSISPYTAMKLQKLLREVVLNEKGTGRWFKELPYAVAGKSGTAETGIYKDGKQLHNKWFAGYFPYEKPKYALVTVNLGVYGDEGGINGLFADMVNRLYDMDQKETVSKR